MSGHPRERYAGTGCVDRPDELPVRFWFEAGLRECFWGNDDGRFLFSPPGCAETNDGPCLDGPFNSVRQENLREGMEDYQHFRLPQRATDHAGAASVDSSLIDDARRLLWRPLNFR